MALTWNPRHALDTYPGTLQFHCSGTTLRGVRCRNHGFFSRELLLEASQILDNLPPPEHFRNDLAQLLPILKRLAFCTLCPRWHQRDRPNHRSQVDSVANAWLGIIMQLAAQRPNLRSDNRRVGPFSIQAAASTTLASRLADASRTARASAASNPYPSPPSSRSITPTSSNNPTPSRRSLPSQGTPSAGSSPTSSPSQSSRTTQDLTSGLGSVQVDVNVSVNVGGQPRHQRSHRTQPITSSNNTNPQSLSRRTSATLSTNSLAGDTLVVARRDLEAVLNHIASLEARLAERSNQTSRASSRSSSRALEHHRSQAPSPSTITNLSLPPPTNPDAYVLEIQSPLRSPHNRSLSTSTNVPASTHTLSSSNTSTPTPSSPADPIPAFNNSFTGLPRRRPIDNTSCYVCYEIIEHPEDAAWCRNGCGQNVCLECFATWRAHQESQGHALTCGFCRAPWRL